MSDWRENTTGSSSWALHRYNYLFLYEVNKAEEGQGGEPEFKFCKLINKP